MLAVGATDWSPLPDQCFLVFEKLDLASARSRYFSRKIEGNSVICPAPELFSASLEEQPIFSPQFLTFKIPNFFLEGNSGTKTLDQEERRDFGYSRQSLGMSHFPQRKLEDIWDLTTSKINMEAKQYCISTGTNTIQQQGMLSQ